MAKAEENKCCRMYRKIRQLIPQGSDCICVASLFKDNCLICNVLDTCRWEHIDANGHFEDEESLSELIDCNGLAITVTQMVTELTFATQTITKKP